MIFIMITAAAKTIIMMIFLVLVFLPRGDGYDDNVTRIFEITEYRKPLPTGSISSG